MTKIMKGGVAFNALSNTVALTQAEYNALSYAQKNNGNFYFITDANPSYFSASNIDYTSASSRITATNVQNAIDEIDSTREFSYKFGTSETGSQKLKISINAYSSWMLSFVVTLYSSYRATKIMISGYNYGVNHWYSPQAIILGDSTGATVNVYFGYDSDWHLWVGFDVGNYLGVNVTDITNGHTQVNLAGLFTFTKSASLSGTTQSTVSARNPYADNNTTYTFTGGTNKFTVTPSGGTAQDVTVTPSITNNITGSGSTNYIPKFTGTNTIANGFGTTTSVTSGSGSLVTSGGVYSAFTSRFKRTSSSRNFTSKTTMSSTGLSLSCPSGHLYLVQAWFRYNNGSPRVVAACHSNTTYAAYDCVAASTDAQNAGHASLSFILTPGETIYYWAMYYNASANFISETVFDITL